MKAGQHPRDPAILRQLARLMQIHLLTHPRRLAKRHGISDEYVRRQFRNMNCPDMDALAVRLDAWIGRYEARLHARGSYPLEDLARDIEQWIAEYDATAKRAGRRSQHSGGDGGAQSGPMLEAKTA